MNTRTYAVIDVGSNSVRLMVARAQDDRLSVLCRDRATTRLMNGAMDGVVRLSGHTAGGGVLIPVCAVQGGALQSVTLTISSVSHRPMRKAERQREFLFARLNLQDPFPDTFEPVHITCPFGDLHLSTDPYTGRTEARIIYTAR